MLGFSLTLGTAMRKLERVASLRTLFEGFGVQVFTATSVCPGCLFLRRHTSNNQLRTGTDKGNLTV
jgi:hypothetical protein